MLVALLIWLFNFKIPHLQLNHKVKQISIVFSAVSIWEIFVSTTKRMQSVEFNNFKTHYISLNPKQLIYQSSPFPQLTTIEHTVAPAQFFLLGWEGRLWHRLTNLQSFVWRQMSASIRGTPTWRLCCNRNICSRVLLLNLISQGFNALKLIHILKWLFS